VAAQFSVSLLLVVPVKWARIGAILYGGWRQGENCPVHLVRNKPWGLTWTPKSHTRTIVQVL